MLDTSLPICHHGSKAISLDKQEFPVNDGFPTECRQRHPYAPSADRTYPCDSKGRRIWVLPPSGYRCVSCSAIVSNKESCASCPVLLLEKLVDPVRPGAGLPHVPGILTREMPDAEMIITTGLKPLIKNKRSSDHPVSADRIPAGLSLAPEAIQRLEPPRRTSTQQSHARICNTKPRQP